MVNSISIRTPDDWHLHLRDGELLEAVLPYTTRAFARAIIMPNLNPAVTNATEARAYRKRIMDAVKDADFTPLMTLYMTDETTPEMIKEAYGERDAFAVKLYPANATTNSAHGVTDVRNVYKTLETMQELGMPLLMHGETVIKDGKEIDTVDREKVFLDSTLPQLMSDFPALKFVLEHATTKDAVQFVMERDASRLGSTITLHHLMENSDLVGASAEPEHLRCMPVIKSPENQKALRSAATSGDAHFFLGTDSAPHPLSKKQSGTPPAGVFTAPVALELYAQLFDEEGKLENFEKFASINGPTFYALPVNKETVSLGREPWTQDGNIPLSGDALRPFGYTEDPSKNLVINWKII